MKPINLFGEGVQSISPNLTAQRRVNCIFEVIGTGENQSVGVRGTPGLTIFVTLPTFPIRGMIEAGQYLYVVAGTAVYQVCQNGGYVLIGNIGLSTNVNPVDMAINETQVMIVDGVTGYVFNYALIQAGNASEIATLILNTSLLQTLCLQTGNS